MKNEKLDPEIQDFLTRVGKKFKFWEPIRAFVNELGEEGVLDLFVCREKVVALNALLDSKLGATKYHITEDDDTGFFASVLFENCLRVFRERNLKEVTDQEVKEVIDEYIDDVSWVKVFNAFWWMAYLMKEYIYNKRVEDYKVACNGSEELIAEVTKLYSEAFPRGVMYEFPTHEWEKKHQNIRDEFDLGLYLEEEFITEVFDDLQSMTQRKIPADVREAADIMATSMVELELMQHALDELNVSADEADEDEMYNWLYATKVENKLYIMAMYYLFAYECVSIVSGKK